jgi:hypothetical protein
MGPWLKLQPDFRNFLRWSKYRCYKSLFFCKRGGKGKKCIVCIHTYEKAYVSGVVEPDNYLIRGWLGKIGGLWLLHPRLRNGQLVCCGLGAWIGYRAKHSAPPRRSERHPSSSEEGSSRAEPNATRPRGCRDQQRWSTAERCSALRPAGAPGAATVQHHPVARSATPPRLRRGVPALSLMPLDCVAVGTSSAGPRPNAVRPYARRRPPHQAFSTTPSLGAPPLLV